MLGKLPDAGPSAPWRGPEAKTRARNPRTVEAMMTPVQLDIDRNAERPIYLQISDGIAKMIAAGDLASGERLPTVRALAGQLAVTRVTVHNAYSHLQAEGLTESTVGRGTFVAEPPGGVAPALMRPAPWYGPVDMGLQLLRGRDVDSMALAEPDPRLAPAAEFMEALAGLENPDLSLLRYGATEGDSELRARIAGRLQARDVRCSPEEILVTTGSTQALSLITQALARPGEKVLVELPTYFGFLSTLKVHDITPLGVPMDEQGPDPETMERLIVRERPRFFYTMPSFHNPTGVTMSGERRNAILALSARYALPIVEDDIFHPLSYRMAVDRRREGAPGAGPIPGKEAAAGEAGGRGRRGSEAAEPPEAADSDEPAHRSPTPLRAEDERGMVIYVDSFSKSLLPGLRIGYLLAPSAFRPRIAGLHYAATLGSAHILQRALAAFLDRGSYDRHVRRVVPHYRRRRDALLVALRKEMPQGAKWTSPQGGFCCWVTLPAGISTEEIFRASMDKGVAFTPGHLFEAQPRAQGRLRLCFGTLPPERIREAIGILGGIVREAASRARPDLLAARRTSPLV